jgi:cold shock CspA family protein
MAERKKGFVKRHDPYESIGYIISVDDGIEYYFDVRSIVGDRVQLEQGQPVTFQLENPYNFLRLEPAVYGFPEAYKIRIED